jgi:small subunit ribosomal protein S18
MARNNMRTTKRAPKDLGRRIKKKPCALCQANIEWVDYKNSGMLKRYMSERGKIRARRVSGNCEQHQREIAEAIKTARELALLPYTQRTVTGRGPSRDAEEAPMEILEIDELVGGGAVEEIVAVDEVVGADDASEVEA